MEFISNLEQIPKEHKLIIPIQSDCRKHWTENRLSFIYFYGLETFQESILGINHNDVSNCEIQRLSEFLGTDNYIYQSKILIDCRANYDVDLLVWFRTNFKLEFEENQVIRSYHHQFYKIENLNDAIPIMKWLEHCREIKDRFLIHYKDFKVTEPFLRYNQLLRDLAEIEKNGLFTN